MIEIKNLTKKYPSVTVYEDFNLSFEEGKITCILGESGCGKTTLLNVIARLTEFDGEVPRLKCSYVFQKPNLLPNLTVYENLKLVNADGEKIDQILKICGMEEKKNVYPNRLSGGQAQRVSVARAFLYPADIILMDEPFSSLDLKLKISVAELFVNTQRNQNRTAIFVTHDVDEAVMLSDRIILLKNGKIFGDFTPHNANLPRPLGGDATLRNALINSLLQ